MPDFVMLKHIEHGQFWSPPGCPASVVDEMKKLGWEETDDWPVEVNPALIERPAEWFEPIPGPEPEPVKTRKRASASTEGTDTDG